MNQRILQRPATIFAGAALLLMGAGTALSQSNGTSDEHSASRLPVEEIAASLRAQGYTSISEIDKHDRWYKVEARDALGAEVELYVNAQTGELLQPGDRLGAEEIGTLVRAMGYTEILESDPEGPRYEVDARDVEGRKVSLYVDALSGEVLGMEYDDDDD